jgi:hypothetical protein
MRSLLGLFYALGVPALGFGAGVLVGLLIVKLGNVSAQVPTDTSSS